MSNTLSLAFSLFLAAGTLHATARTAHAQDALPDADVDATADTSADTPTDSSTDSAADGARPDAASDAAADAVARGPDASPNLDPDEGDCGCRVGAGNSGNVGLLPAAGALALGLFAARRTRRRQSK